MSLDKAKVRELRNALAAALSDHGIDGYEVMVGHASYSSDNATFKVEVAKIGTDGEVATKAATDFKQRALAYGLEAADLGREFRHAGRLYRVTGLNPKARRYPILCLDQENERTYKFSPDMVNAELRRHELCA